jgi:hypothetical protein
MRLWCTRKSLSAPRDHRMADGYSLRSVAGTEMTKRVNVWCHLTKTAHPSRPARLFPPIVSSIRDMYVIVQE